LIFKYTKHKKPSYSTNSIPAKALVLEQLEPRILLSGDSLLNTSLDLQQEIIPGTELQICHQTEFFDTNNQIEEQISQEPTPYDTPDSDGYQPILTLCVDDENEEYVDEDLSISNVDSAQINCDIAVLSNDADGIIESLGTTEDGSMPLYINDADLSKEYATSIEIRGPSTSGIGGTSDDTPEGLIGTITTTGSNALVYLPSELVWDSADLAVTPSSVESSSLIRMDTFRADQRFFGIDGAGFATVILDTGIDLDHPFFGPDLDSDGVADRIVYQWDYAYNDSDASDISGHGSNVSSIVASSDSTYTGMAPGADIIHLKVLNDSGKGSFAWIESALQWVVNNVSTYNIVSVNMSLGDLNNYSAAIHNYGLGDELAALDALDVIVVSASGNQYSNFNYQGVSYPAADPNSLSVGAVYDSNAGRFDYSSGAIAYSTDVDRISPFSQRHETLTTIFAPGAPITGAGPTGGLSTYHGTSQASPHIAGIAVLAQQLAHEHLGRRLTVNEFAALLQDTAIHINDGDDEDDNVANTGLDFPRVDMLALGEAILAMAYPDPQILLSEDFTDGTYNGLQRLDPCRTR
jgi:hypothetical protein